MEYGTDFGKIVLHIEALLKDKGISKNQVCKDLDIPRTNFNRYCRDQFQRIDSGLICRLCWYLGIKIEDIMEYVPPENGTRTNNAEDRL